DRFAAGLGAHLIDHRQRRLDAVNVEDSHSVVHRGAARAGAELEHASAAREVAQECHLRRGVAALVPGVVDVGDTLAVGFGSVLHSTEARTMFIDAALRPTDLAEVPDAARQIEAAGYDGMYTVEGPHDAMFPLLIAGEHTER